MDKAIYLVFEVAKLDFLLLNDCMKIISPRKEKKKIQEYDYLIIGGGLSGLSLATALSQKNGKVALLDVQDVLGGYQKPIKTPLGLKDNGLRFVPGLEEATSVLNWMHHLVQENINFEERVVENPIISYLNSEKEVFIGFGNEKPPFYEEISYFLNSRRVHLEKPFYRWMEDLQNHFNGDFYPRSQVTQLEGSIEDGKVNSIQINKGSMNLKAERVIYCGSVKELVPILPEGALSSKARQRISKSKFTSAICLDLIHAQPLNVDTDMVILNGASADPIHRPEEKIPLIGQIQGHEPGGQLSQWITFFDSDDQVESERIASLIKRMKKLINKSFPNALDQLKFERILVVPNYAGNGDLKVQKDYTFSDFKNLHLCSSTLQRNGNIIGAISNAKKLYEVVDP